MFKQSLFKATARAIGPVGVIGALGGFLSDVLLPLANFAPFIAGASVFFTIVLAVYLLRLDARMDDRDVWDTVPGAVYLVTGGAAMIFSVWSVFLIAGPERGYVADNIDPIADIQARLLGIEQDVAEIKETTEQIATQQAESFASLEDALATIQSGQLVIVQNPTTSQDWYNNAKVYQLRGDTANAIAAYEGYFASDGALTFVDPFEDYIDLILATQGIARARDMLAGMRGENPDNPTAALMSASLLDSVDERIAEMESLSQTQPGYGPVFFYLGQEYDRKLRESITNDLLEKQAAAYTRLFEIESVQGFSIFYIDKLAAQDHVETAQLQFESYQQASNAFGSVDLQVTFLADGALFIVIFPETTGQGAFYSIDDPNPQTAMGKTTIGSTRYIDQAVGPLAVPVGDHTFYFRYVDQNGVESEVYSFPFRMEPVIVNFTANPPDFSTGALSGTLLFQIPYVEVANGYTYNYSLDDDSLDQSVAGVAVATVELTDLEAGEHVLYVQAVSDSGEKTEVVVFSFTVE